MKEILIIGGSSGVGLLLAEKYAREGHIVTITGRTNPKTHNDRISFFELDLSFSADLIPNIQKFFSDTTRKYNTLVYSAGVYCEGLIDEIKDQTLLNNLSVNYLSAQLIIREILQSQGSLDNIVGISSIAQFRAPQRESYYAANKAGFGKFIETAAEDTRVKNTLLVVPAGIDSPFWRNHKKSPEKLKEYIKPKRLADEIYRLAMINKKFSCYKILRSPIRIEEISRI